MTPRSERKNDSTVISPSSLLTTISHTKSYNNNAFSQKTQKDTEEIAEAEKARESRQILANCDITENCFRKAQITLSPPTIINEKAIYAGTTTNNSNGLNLMGHFKNLVNVIYFIIFLKLLFQKICIFYFIKTSFKLNLQMA